MTADGRNHFVNDGGPATWKAIHEAVGSINKGWPGPPSSRLDPDRLPLTYTTSTGDPAITFETSGLDFN